MTLTLDGSRQVDSNQEEGTAVMTLASQLDPAPTSTASRVPRRPSWSLFRSSGCPNAIGVASTWRKKEIVVIVIPYCSPDPQGPKYEQYCRHAYIKAHAASAISTSQRAFGRLTQRYTHKLTESTFPLSSTVLGDDIR